MDIKSILVPAILGAIIPVFSQASSQAEGTSHTADSAPAAIMVNPAERFQTIRGFGASGAWWPNYVAEFPKEKRDKMLRLLFTDAGADMTIYRYNLPAGDGEDVTDPLRRTALVETAPGEYDFSRDWKAQLILREVRALGVEQFVLFSKSPPPRMLINGKVSGGDNGLSNLRHDKKDDFARYLLDVTMYLKTNFDLPQVALSPINEPQWHWGRDRRHQEGCHYTPEEVAMMLRELIKERNARGLQNIELHAPESGAWWGNEPFVEAMFNDPLIAENIHSFVVHSYWSNPDHRREFVAWFRERFPDKPLLMTEFCQMEHGHDLSIEGGLYMANVMHEDLVVASVETWQWWLCIFVGGFKDALIYAHPETQKIEPTKRLWTMAHFSRFIRPGATRIGAEIQGDLRVSAYLSRNEEYIAIVVINNGEAQTVRPTLPERNIRTVTTWVTDADRDLARIDGMDPRGIEIPRRSIVTLVVPMTN